MWRYFQIELTFKSVGLYKEDCFYNMAMFSNLFKTIKTENFPENEIILTSDGFQTDDWPKFFLGL